MRQPNAVLTIIAALGLHATVALPAAAADQIALVGCDLLAEGGPVALFQQIAGEEAEQDNRFVFRSGDSFGDTRDVAGRSCAEVLAELANDGFEFQDADFSRGSFLKQWVSIWQKTAD